MKRTRWIFGLLVALMALRATAEVDAVITKEGTGEKIRGKVVWLPAMKKYQVTTPDNIRLQLDPREVADLQVRPPERFETLVQAVQKGQYAAAIPALQKIVEDYTMLQWDAVAGRWLAKAYLETREASKAAALCESILAANPRAAWSDDLAPVYWDALIETGQYGKLDEALKKAAQMGSRELAAVAQIKRGDMERKKGNLREALVDGYLRTAYFFQSVKSVQPEALYKAMQVFQTLNQSAYAEAMRKRLLSEFPQDPYAEKARTGG